MYRRRNTTLTVIDNQPNLTFVLNTQNKGLKVAANNIISDVMRSFDIDKFFAQDALTINSIKINYVLYDYFEENFKYMSDIEKIVMSKFSLQYVENIEEHIMKGCITGMITLKKNEWVIFIYYIIFIYLLFVIYYLTFRLLSRLKMVMIE